MENNESGFILTVDIGTSSIRSFLWNEKAQIIGRASRPITLLYPNPGYVEQNPTELWKLCKTVIRESVKDAKISVSSIRSLGICTNRGKIIAINLSIKKGSFCTWNKTTGKPVHNIITWQDTRAAKDCDVVNNSYSVRGLQRLSKAIHVVTRSARFATGSSLKFRSVQCITRLKWVLNNIPEASKLANEGNLLFGCIETWLLYKLTGGKVHATDYSNISVTGLWDPYINNWNDLCMSILGGIPHSIFPKVMDTSGLFGHVNPIVFGKENKVEVPITCLIGDQQSSLFGHCCFESGDSKCTMGTGCFLSVNTGNKLYAASNNAFYPMIAWKIGNEFVYSVEGIDSNSGSAIEWLKDIGFINDVKETEEIVNSVSSSEGVYFVPAFSGLVNPHNDDGARASMFGISRDTKKAHIVRAVLEGVVLRMTELLTAMVKEVPFKIHSVKVDGGVTNNKFVMQNIAEMNHVTIEKAEQTEITSQGCAFLAGLAVGMWKKSELKQFYHVGVTFTPSSQTETQEQSTILYYWKKAISRTLGWIS